MIDEYIWDMELTSYKNTKLSSIDINCSINIVKQYGSEDLFPYIIINRVGLNKWIGQISLFINKTSISDIESRFLFIKGFYYGYSSIDLKREFLEVIIEEDLSIDNAVIYIEHLYELFVEEIEHPKDITEIWRYFINNNLPIYRRAMNYVKIELDNFLTDEIKNSAKIVDITGRVKSIDSIYEKVIRKNIYKFDVFTKFNDIAGVRCNCEYLDDVYEVLEYIKKNTLINIVDIDDKMEISNADGYRGVHVIVDVPVYYKEKEYKNIKVEIQLRTSFQNAWSMKTHSLTYKKEMIDDDIKTQMKQLSDILYEADKVSAEMKKIIEN